MISPTGPRKILFWKSCQMSMEPCRSFGQRMVWGARVFQTNDNKILWELASEDFLIFCHLICTLWILFYPYLKFYVSHIKCTRPILGYVKVLRYQVCKIVFYTYFDWLKRCMFLNVLWSVYWKVACIYLFLYLEIKEKFQPNV